MDAMVFRHHIFHGAHRGWKGDPCGLADFTGHSMEGGAQEIPLVTVPDFDLGQGRRSRRISTHSHCQPRSAARRFSSSSSTKARNEQNTWPLLVASHWWKMSRLSTRDLAAFKQNLDKVYELFPRLQERTRQKAGTLSGGE